MEDYEVGDILLVGTVETTITEIDHMTDTFACLSPRGLVTVYRRDEIEQLPYPDTEDREAVEAWLRIKARVIPHARVVTSVQRCDQFCECRYCHRRWSTFEDQSRHMAHHCDAPACTCRVRHCMCIFEDPDRALLSQLVAKRRT